MTYFQLFLQNLIIELIFLSLFFYQVNKKQLVLGVIFANGLTHPWVVLGIMSLTGAPLLKMLLIAEILTILVEGFIYHRVFSLNLGIAMGGALIANLLSWELGPRLSYLMNKLSLTL